MLEVMRVVDLPKGHHGNLFVFFSKKRLNLLFNTKRRISGSPESAGEEKVAIFDCEPTGELMLELSSYSASRLPKTSPTKVNGNYNNLS